mgnify:CR=1 FL=1
MKARFSKRRFLISATLSILFLPGCSLRSDGGANLALTNASDSPAQITVNITDRESGETIMMDSYQVPVSDDGILVEDVVTTTGSYDVKATVENTGKSATSVWRIPSENNPENYAIRIGLLSNGSLKISGDGI